MNGRLPRGLQPEDAFTGVSTDSRTVRKGDLFIALKGERFDGHDFVGEALRRGAHAAVVDEEWLTSQDRRAVRGKPLIGVPDTLEALQELARYHRRRMGIPLIGVTGSNGKTTTKEMTASVLGGRFRVLKSEASFNNHIGVPLTLLRLRRAHEAAVLELGTNHPGEIAELCRIAAPSAGIITNVGPVHLEFLGDEEGVARAKGELADAIGRDGFLVLNADDERVMGLASRTPARKVTFGFSEGADVRPEGLELRGGAFARFLLRGERVRLRVPGRHNVHNALAAAAAGFAMGCEPAEVREGLESYRGTAWRGELVRTGGLLVLNDAYNANPVSTARALDLLAEWQNGKPRRKVAVLGDMLELGEAAPEAHAEAGRRAAAAAVDLLVAVGSHAEEMARAAEASGLDAERIETGRDVEGAWSVLQQRLRSGDLVLLKGSRAVGLEQLVDRLRGLQGPTPEGEEA
ncbi:MAG: UDP-N-acetylmuramoyl-tripeptide--D-alanyl-D-alanine ligase [bacterium]